MSTGRDEVLDDSEDEADCDEPAIGAWGGRAVVGVGNGVDGVRGVAMYRP